MVERLRGIPLYNLHPPGTFMSLLSLEGSWEVGKVAWLQGHAPAEHRKGEQTMGFESSTSNLRLVYGEGVLPTFLQYEAHSSMKWFIYLNGKVSADENECLPFHISLTSTYQLHIPQTVPGWDFVRCH